MSSTTSVEDRAVAVGDAVARTKAPATDRDEQPVRAGRYFVAFAAVAAATVLKWLFPDSVGHSAPLTVYLGAVMVTAWYGGQGPGLVATALSVLAGDYWFAFPYSSFRVSSVQDVMSIAFGAVEGAIISVLTGRLRRAMSASHAQAALFARQIESSPDGILVVESDHRTAFYNRRFAGLWGLPKETVQVHVGNPALASMLQKLKDPQAFLGRLHDFHRDPSLRSHEEVPLLDGRVFDWYSEPLPIEVGRGLGRIFFFRDITERKNAEIELARERDLLTALIESLPGFFVLVDSSGRIVESNENLRVFAGNKGESEASNVLDLVPQADRPTVLGILREAMSGKPVAADLRVVSAAGEERTVLATTRRTEQGGAPLVLGIAIDVTDARRAGQRVAESEARFRTIFDSVSDGIILHDLQTGAVVDANHRLCEMFGYSREELLGMDVHALSADGSSETQQAAARLTELARNGAPQKFEWHARAKGGRAIWIDVALQRAQFGAREYLLSTAHDVTERKEASDALVYRDRILHAITSGTALLVAGKQIEGGIESALEEVGKVLGVDRVVVVELRSEPADGAHLRWAWQRSDVPVRLTKESFRRVAPSTAERASWLAPLVKGEPVVTHRVPASGPVLALLERLQIQSMMAMPIFVDGRLWGSMGLHQCSCQRQWTAIEVGLLTIFAGVIGSALLREETRASLERDEERFRALARIDPLTGLANRRVFVESVESALARSHRGAKGFAVLYLDLDHFKDINDTLGHPTGDLLLQEVARRLRATTRGDDLIARFGGDEFAMIATDATDATDVIRIAERLQTALQEPVTIGTSEIRTGASIGLALYGPDSTDAETLLSHADVALYRAKAEGRGVYRFFTSTMDAEVRARVVLASELRQAIDGEQLFLVYQPQVDLLTRRIVGVEGLVRWRHPRKGVVGPGEFIPVAERSGLIVSLGTWVLRAACRQARAWLDAEIAPPSVAINVSGRQLKTPQELERTVLTILSETGLPPDRLEIELTESVLMDTWTKHDDTIARLRKAGIKIAIDDFGTGFSSLEYLSRFPVDRIKIAQHFVAQLTRRPESAAIVRATIGLARELRIGIVAEGVETEEQLALLEGWGCSQVQGYYFARPLLPDAASALLHQGRCDGPSVVAAPHNASWETSTAP